MTSTVISNCRAPAYTPVSIPPAAAWHGTIVPGTEASSIAVQHVSNVEYVRWLDQVAQDHLECLGWSSDDLLAAGAMWFIARHEIDYRKEAYAGETFQVATWVRTIRRVKSWRDTVVWRAVQDQCEVVCTASTLWVHVDLATRRPTSPPDDMIAALRPAGEVAPPPWRDRV